MVDDRGRRLRIAMKARGVYKQYSLAVDLGVDQSTLSRWSKGGSLTLQHALKLSEALDVSLDWILLGRGCMEHHKKRPILNGEWEIIQMLRQLDDDVVKSIQQHVYTLKLHKVLNDPH